MPNTVTVRFRIPLLRHWWIWGLLAVARTVLLVIVCNSWLICMSMTVGGKSPWFWLYPEGEIAWFTWFPALRTPMGYELMGVVTYTLVILDTLVMGYMVSGVRDIGQRKVGNGPVVSASESQVWPPPPSSPQV